MRPRLAALTLGVVCVLGLALGVLLGSGLLAPTSGSGETAESTPVMSESQTSSTPVTVPGIGNSTPPPAGSDADS